MMSKKWMVAAAVGLIWMPVTPVVAQEQAPDFSQIMQAMMQGSTNQTVNFRAIRDWMPETLGGLERTSASGERSSAMGMTIAFAEAEYRGDAGTLTVKVTDMSALGQMAKMAQVAWTQMDIDRETDYEVERTTTIDGHRAMEKYNLRRSEGEIQLFVDGRFSVEVRSTRMELDALRAVLSELDFTALTALQPDA